MSLTFSAAATRKLIKYGGIGSILIFFILLTVVSMAKAYRLSHPVKVLPNVQYGKLPAIVFPVKQFERKNFTLEIPDDKMPKISDQAKVYIVFRSDKNFLALEGEKENAKKLDFESEPLQTANGIYEFKNQDNQTLRVNIFDGNLKMTYPYQTDPTLMEIGKVPNANEAQDIAKSYLSRADKWHDDFEEKDNKVTFWKIENETLKPVSAQSEANFVRVDIVRKKVDSEITIISSDKNKAPVSVLISGSNMNNKQVVEMDYKYTNIDRESFATYPIITIDQAIANLKNGNYWPVSDTADQNVIIRRIYLAYFEPVSLTNYMQPVFVFEGDNNFQALTPAILPEFIAKTEQ